MRDIRSIVILVGCALAATVPAIGARQAETPQTAAVPSGVREASWSPDSKRLAVSRFDAIWTMAPDGAGPKRLVTKAGDWIVERDPAWSPDGKTIAFAAKSNGQFDLWTAPSAGGAAIRVTSMPGDERSPSWTKDGRLVFAHRASKAVWQIVVASADGTGQPVTLTTDEASEWQPQVSPDGTRVAFVSDREPEPGNETDIWTREVPARDAKPATTRPTRITRIAGDESFPAWAPDNARVAYAAIRGGGQNGVWVSTAPAAGAANAAAGDAGGRGAGRGRQGGAQQPGLPTQQPGLPNAPGLLNPPALPSQSVGLQGTVQASRRLGVPAWSPDSQTLAIATFAVVNAAYNGNPQRNDDDVPMAFSDASQFALWRVAAPRAVDEGAASVTLPSPDASRWSLAFDQVWQTMKTMYFPAGDSAAKWDALRAKYRPKAEQAKDAVGVEDALDAMIAEQPFIKPAVESSRGVAVSAHPLASQAGALILEKGGNVVDAGIAVALALGVVEPDATSLGGDGQAILFLNGMTEPVIIEYKDMTPGHATSDNPKLFTPTGGRTAPDGPTVANIPGVAAGLDLLYQKYGSKKVAWADIVEPAIKLADEGFVLDDALPTSIAEGRASFAKYPESAKVFLPNGRVPRAGERFVNKDYAETLRTIAKEGAQSFYRGTIAQKIAADMAANGGVITLEDLAQYRAMERKPLVGRYRNHLVYSVAPPVSTGAQLLETLQILDQYQPRAGARYTTDADYLHYVIESWRVRDGGGRIADPERWPVDLGNHLEPVHAVERFKLIDPKKVYSAPGGRGVPPPTPPGYQSEDESGPVQTGTTAFVVADGQGNMIAFTQTLSTWGGNYYVSKGLGFLYNDHFRGGRGGTGFGSMLPLMRSNSTSVPTLVFAPASGSTGRYSIPGYVPLLAVGCAGNAWIPASVYDVILNVVDGGMSAQEAIEAPRLLIGARTQIEDRFPRSILADLESRGHMFQKVGRKGEVKYGYAAAAVVNSAKATAQGGAEPRRSHATAGAR